MRIFGIYYEDFIYGMGKEGLGGGDDGWKGFRWRKEEFNGYLWIFGMGGDLLRILIYAFGKGFRRSIFL